MPLYPGFCGPHNPSQSVIANCEQLINWYPELIQSRTAPAEYGLYPTPGRQRFATGAAHIEGRAAFAMNGRTFVVIGAGFYEVFSDGSLTLHGLVTLDDSPATISYNGVSGGQLFITSGGNGYSFILASNTFGTIAALNGEATMGGMLNSRFLAFSRATGHVRFSGLNDVTSWDSLDFFGRSQAADPWVSMLVNGNEIWLIGEQTGEVWFDNGDFPLPYAVIPGAIFPRGTCAPFSVAKAGDFVVWLAQDKDGAGSIVAARGYTPTAVSSYAVETAIAQYIRDGAVADCEVLVYSDQGHTFANFSFPSANVTHTLDVTMDMTWHVRGTWDSAAGAFAVWGPRAHCFAFGKHLVVSRNSGAVEEMDVTIGSEVDGSAIRRVRIPPPLWAPPGQRLEVSRLQILVEPGVALASGLGDDPQLMMRSSYNAKTWGNERQAGVGRMGDYSRRCVFTRCGSSDFLFVPEISVSDPIPWRIVGAFIDGRGISGGRAAA